MIQLRKFTHKEDNFFCASFLGRLDTLYVIGTLYIHT
jgi:hypothetical protein